METKEFFNKYLPLTILIPQIISLVGLICLIIGLACHVAALAWISLIVVFIAEVVKTIFCFKNTQNIGTVYAYFGSVIFIFMLVAIFAMAL